MKKTLLNRILPGILIVAYILINTIPLSIFSHSSIVARVFSYIFVYSLFFIMIFELFSAMRIPKYWSIFYMIIFAPVVIFPLTMNLHWFDKGSIMPTDISLIKLMAKTGQNLAKEPMIFLLPLISSISFILLETIIRKNSFVNSLTRFFVILSSTYILIIFIKIFQISIIYKGAWTYWISVIIVSSATDITGWLAGKYFGRKFIQKPFAPVISPNKTWEGFIGSVLLGTIASFSVVFGFNLFHNHILNLLFGLFAPLISILGDLYFSYIKRINGIKDYSKMLGGHGGLLDRLDSNSFISFFSFMLLLFA